MFTITLPVYHTLEETKKRKAKTILVSSNWFRNAHYFDKNNVKQHYDRLAYLKLVKEDVDAIEGKFRTKYRYYYKNKGSDGSNVVSMMEKFFLDTLQSSNVVKEDNVLFHSSDGFRCYEDKANPRIEIDVYEVKDETS